MRNSTSARSMSEKPGPSTIVRARASCSSAGRTSPASCRAHASPESARTSSSIEPVERTTREMVSYSRSASSLRWARVKASARASAASTRPRSSVDTPLPGSPARRPAVRPASRSSPGSGASSPARSGSGTPSRSAGPRARSASGRRRRAAGAGARRSVAGLGPSLRTRRVVSFIRALGECAPHFTQTQGVPGGTSPQRGMSKRKAK